MERLVHKRFNRNVVDAFDVEEVNWCDENSNNNESAIGGKAIDKLGEYEETELTPEEIITLNNFFESQLAKLLVDNCKLKNDRDFWEREAKKYCSLLGEVRILASQELCNK